MTQAHRRREETDATTRLMQKPDCPTRLLDVASDDVSMPRAARNRSRSNAGQPSWQLAATATARAREMKALSGATVAAPSSVAPEKPTEVQTRLHRLAQRPTAPLAGWRARATGGIASLVMVAVCLLAWTWATRGASPDTTQTMASKPQLSGFMPTGSASAPAPDAGSPTPGDAARAPAPRRITPAVAAEHLAAGRYASARKAYRALAAKHPSNPVYSFIAEHLERKRLRLCGPRHNGGSACRTSDPP